MLLGIEENLHDNLFALHDASGNRVVGPAKRAFGRRRAVHHSAIIAAEPRIGSAVAEESAKRRIHARGSV